jgi:CheY-like chemotaxis protein
MPAVPRVLVLEDEPLIAVMVRDWLDELGCETVGPAHTVPAALALIEGALLDGAILDMTIGRETDWPRATRTCPHWPSRTILRLSGRW